MVITIVVITQMRIRYIVLNVPVHKTVSDVQIIVAYQVLGSVIRTMIVEMAPMNHQNIVNKKDEHALEICLHVITEIVFPKFISVMEIM